MVSECFPYGDGRLADRYSPDRAHSIDDIDEKHAPGLTNLVLVHRLCLAEQTVIGLSTGTPGV